MIIKYFYKHYLKYQLNPAQTANFFLMEKTILFTNVIFRKKQFVGANFFFYSMLSFYMWANFIVEHQLYLWLILEAADINIFKALFVKLKCSVLATEGWIPGIVSNSFVVWNGTRYERNIIEGNIQTDLLPDFLFFFSTKRPLILQEIHAQLIPQFILVSNIEALLSKYFIPLFIPKWNSKIGLLLNPIHANMPRGISDKTKAFKFSQYLLKRKNMQDFSYLLLLEIIINLQNNIKSTIFVR